jgi:L-malate glycosyltransferase
MKVLFFSSYNSHHDCKWINQISLDNQVQVISTESQRSSKLNADIQIHKILPLYSLRKKNRNQVLQNINQIIRDFQPDIMHSMYLFPNSIWANESGFRPHIITTRGSDILVEYPNNYHNITSKFKPLIFRHFNKSCERALQNAQFITCTSEFQEEKIKKLTKTNVQTIRTGIDIEKIDAAISANTIQKKEAYIIFSPRESKPLYNLDIIVKAFHLFVKKCDNAILVMLTDDSLYSEKINKLVHELGIEENVKLVTELTFPQLIEQYRVSNQVVMIPASDGTPNTALEAMLCKTPVILGQANYDELIFNLSTVSKIDKPEHEILAKEMNTIYCMGEAELSAQTERAAAVVRSNANLSDSIQSITAIYNKVR